MAKHNWCVDCRLRDLDCDLNDPDSIPCEEGSCDKCDEVCGPSETLDQLPEIHVVKTWPANYWRWECKPAEAGQMTSIGYFDTWLEAAENALAHFTNYHLYEFEDDNEDS